MFGVKLLIRKAVIPAAGLGTRLLSVTKEQPKEMLPVFARTRNGNLCVKPLLQLVFEQLHDVGIRDYCLIIGRGKRAIEDHFTPDYSYLDILNARGKNSEASDLQEFYSKVEDSTIVWINQAEPKGFGHAVLQAKPFVERESFLVHAGDTLIVSKGNEHMERLMNAHRKYGGDATILLQKVDDPRQYGVVEADEADAGELRIKRAVEKPEEPPTNLAIMPLYIFEPIILDALRETPPGKGGEIQLTDGIQRLIEIGRSVYGVMLQDDELRLDIGSPDTYWQAQSLSYEAFSRRDVK